MIAIHCEGIKLKQNSMNIAIALLLVSIPSSIASSSASAYLFYEGASCSDSSDISGTITMAWDDSDLSDFGFSMDYEGPCMYFTGGSYSLDLAYYFSAADNIEYGYCVQCNGITGCSSDGTCDTFMSEMPQNSYQMGSNKQKLSEVALQQGYGASQATRQKFQAYNMSSSGGVSEQYNYVIMGGFFGLVALFGLVAVLEGMRQFRNRKASQPFGMSSISETLSYEQCDENGNIILTSKSFSVA